VRDGIDVGAAGDVLLEDVVLEGAGKRGGVDAAVALMVIEVEMRSSGMSAKRRCMSSSESMATPTRPTSPSASGESES
jgi:hypothetical protein